MNKSVDMRIARLADAGGVLGKLQRGLGEGALGVLAMPRAEAIELVWHCIVHDPRWDLQVESRSVYYATLVQKVGLSIDRLRPRHCPIPEPDVDQRLVVEVLGKLAQAGVEGAGEVLLDHVANGEEWDDAILVISEWSRHSCAQLPRVLEARFSSEKCEWIVQRWRREVPWEEFADGRPWIGRAIAAHDEESKAKVRPQFELPAMDLPARELLEYPWVGMMPKRLLHRLTVMLRDGERSDLISSLDVSGSPSWIAFWALARLDDPGGISAAEQVFLTGVSGRSRSAAYQYLTTLSGQHTLEFARRWIKNSDGRVSAAQGILEHHAEESDLPLIIERLSKAWKERDFYALCCFVDALGRLHEVSPVEPLAAIYEEAEYSYARRRAALALVAVDEQRFADRYARAALMDCESEIQDLSSELLAKNAD